MRNLLIAAMLLAATPALAAEKLRVWVQANPAQPDNTDLQNSAQDIIKKFKSKILELAESPEKADITMTVMSRASSNKATVVVALSAPGLGVMAVVHGQSWNNSWTASADNARKNAEKWIEQKFGNTPRKGLLAEVERKADEKAARLSMLTERYGQADAERIAQGVVWIGMTHEQLRESWGSPRDVNTTTTAAGKSEQWVYGDSQYVYLENGRVTAIQQ